MHSKRMKRLDSRAAWGYVFVLPTLLFVLIMNIWPIINSVYISFTDASGFSTPHWIGFGNYVKIFHSSLIGSASINTVIYAVVSVVVGTFLSLILAVALNEKMKGRAVFRTLYFLPVVSTPAAIAMVWRWLLNKDFGLVNYVLSFFGIKGPNWMGDPHWVLTAVIIVGIWSGIGYNMIILLGGMQDIPSEYYEAAQLDGAGKTRQFFNITMPLLSPTLFFVLVTSVIGSLQVFDLIFVMLDKSNPAISSARSIVYIFYDETFAKGNQGYGAAIAVVLLLVILVLTMIMMKLQKKWVTYDK
ncbi:MAG: sugar ABC transporter permease [Bifidobacteriaceae bacterium]|nr:sugar ABC transporter permease [Bifidobacteriaceae bacterium]MCI1914983.1 sugar ABC transporter permease [Bifidobacteriaceae bacterium]